MSGTPSKHACPWWPEPSANLILIHRDADARDATPRYDEIRDAVRRCQLREQWVALVPIQETEAWLLLDEAAIREVAGKPNGRNDLKLPRAALVERKAGPKEALKNALLSAAGVTGRDQARFRQDFGRQRHQLLRDLRTGGPLEQVSAWRRLRDDLRAAILALGTAPVGD